MKFWITALFSLLGTILIAQPSNDDCGSAIDLGTAPYCEDVYFTNVDATASNIGVDNLPLLGCGHRPAGCLVFLHCQ